MSIQTRWIYFQGKGIRRGNSSPLAVVLLHIYHFICGTHLKSNARKPGMLGDGAQLAEDDLIQDVVIGQETLRGNVVSWQFKPQQALQPLFTVRVTCVQLGSAYVGFSTLLWNLTFLWNVRRVVDRVRWYSPSCRIDPSVIKISKIKGRQGSWLSLFPKKGRQGSWLS